MLESTSIPSANPLKRAAAAVLHNTRLTTVSLALQKLTLMPFIRVLYFHDVQSAQADSFAGHLTMLKRLFVPATRADLRDLLRTGQWPHDRPGLIVTFDDGLRCHTEVVAPILERLGFEGWFFLPVDLITAPVEEQPALAARHGVLHACDTERDPRVFMTAGQAAELARRHNVGCHTATHVRLSDELSESQLQLQIVSAKQRLEALLGRGVDSFSWVGGEEWAYSKAAAGCIARHFEFAFTTNTQVTRPGGASLSIERTHVEASYSPALVRLQVSGMMDLYYRSKRRRLAARIGGEHSHVRLHDVTGG